MTDATDIRSPVREAYHHGDLALTLMDQALLRIEQEGVANLSLRALAREAGVSPTAPYRHFPSKRCLLAALATRGFLQLSDALLAATGPDPAAPANAAEISERLIRLGVAYLDFAGERPTTYQMMFGSVLDDFSEYTALQSAANDSFSILNQVLEALQAAGVCDEIPLNRLGGAIWGTVHGMADLVIGNKAKGSQLDGLDLDAQGALQSIAALRDNPEIALRAVLVPMLRTDTQVPGLSVRN